MAPPVAVNVMSALGAASPYCARSVAFGSTSRFSSSDTRLLTSAVTSLLSASVASGSTSFQAPSVFFITDVSPFDTTRSSSTASAVTANTFSLTSVSVRVESTK